MRKAVTKDAGGGKRLVATVILEKMSHSRYIEGVLQRSPLGHSAMQGHPPPGGQAGNAKNPCSCQTRLV